MDRSGRRFGGRHFCKNVTVSLTCVLSVKRISIYDAAEQGIALAQGRYTLFHNSGDAFHDDAALFVRQLARQKSEAMYIGDALLDFGGGHKMPEG